MSKYDLLPNHVYSRKRKRDDSVENEKVITLQNYSISINNKPVVLDEYLGRGAFGNVYLGKLGAEKVAIKIFRPSAKKYFLNECQCLINVRRTSGRVVNLLGFGNISQSSEMFMGLEYIGEKNLRDLLRDYSESEISLLKKEEIMLELLQGVLEIHNSGVCHHDIKPENVLLSDCGLKPTLCDFGLGSAADGDFRRMGKGTTLYMPPEAFEMNSSPPKMSFYSDVWSLGVLFYELLTHGSLPFEGRNNVDIFKRITTEKPHPLPHWLEKSLSNQWKHVIFNMMLQREPSKRSPIIDIISYLKSHNICSSSVAESYQSELEKMKESLCASEKLSVSPLSPLSDDEEISRRSRKSNEERGLLLFHCPRQNFRSNTSLRKINFK